MNFKELIQFIFCMILWIFIYLQLQMIQFLWRNYVIVCILNIV